MEAADSGSVLSAVPRERFGVSRHYCLMADSRAACLRRHCGANRQLRFAQVI
jgi:hypothetical protein